MGHGSAPVLMGKHRTRLSASCCPKRQRHRHDLGDGAAHHLQSSVGLSTVSPGQAPSVTGSTQTHPCAGGPPKAQATTAAGVGAAGMQRRYLRWRCSLSQPPPPGSKVSAQLGVGSRWEDGHPAPRPALPPTTSPAGMGHGPAPAHFPGAADRGVSTGSQGAGLQRVQGGLPGGRRRHRRVRDLAKVITDLSTHKPHFPHWAAMPRSLAECLGGRQWLTHAVTARRLEGPYPRVPRSAAHAAHRRTHSTKCPWLSFPWKTSNLQGVVGAHLAGWALVTQGRGLAGPRRRHAAAPRGWGSKIEIFQNIPESHETFIGACMGVND